MGEVFEVEDQRFREAGKHLAANREADVYAKTVKSLIGSSSEVKAPPSRIPAEAIEESRLILAACLENLDNWPLEFHGFADLGPGFARTYRKCIEAWEDALREPGDDKYHRLRKWSKYHWYQVRILERLDKHELRERRQLLRRFQFDLGDAHDLFALQLILASRADPDMQLLERAIRRKHELYADALKRGEKIFATSVDELVARCAAGWVEWQQ
jgi:CHAD domain-containing protein